MAAYIIADVDIKDPAGFEEYRKLVPATVEKYGGTFRVRGGRSETLEGTWPVKRLVVIEFPTAEQARRWYDSPEYREPKAMRFKTATANLILVEGV
jgi:uncharacterized protein (DUF1330 family)